MNNEEHFNHFLKKVHEKLFLHFRHYIPMGKPEPESYAQLFFQLFKIYESGVLEEMTSEPVMEKEILQLDIFEHMTPDEVADKQPVQEVGTMFDSLNKIADNPE